MGLKRIPLVFIIVLAALPTAMLFQNCSSYNDPSPFEYASKDTSKLISGPADLLLSYPLNSINVDVNSSAIRATGNCNVGQSVSHRIEVTMFNQNNVAIPVSEENGCPGSGAATCLKIDKFICEHGKYNIFLPVNCSAYPSAVANPNTITTTQTLKAQLVTVDAKGAESRDVKASFALAFGIVWAPNICP